MDIFTIMLWGGAAAGFVLSVKKDRKRTFKALKMSSGMMKSMIGNIVGILLMIGLITTFITPEMIQNVLGESNVILSTLGAAVVGSVTLIPAFVAFPLAGSLKNMGADIVPLAAFITTLTMVGIATFPLEKKVFGVKFAIWRNVLSFIFAVIIAAALGGIY